MKNYLFTLLLIISCNSFGQYQLKDTQKKWNITFTTSLRRAPEIKNKVGDYFPNILPSTSFSLGVNRQRKLNEKVYFSYGLNYNAHFHFITSDLLESAISDDKFRHIDTYPSGLNFSFPFKLYYSFLDKKNWNILGSFGFLTSLNIADYSYSSGINYVFLGNENYDLNQNYEENDNLFEFAFSIGTQLQYKERMLFNFDISYHSNTDAGGNLDSKHVVNDKIIKYGYGTFTVRPISYSLGVGYRI